MKHPVPHKGQQEVVGLNFEPAENGLTSHTTHRTARGGQGGGPSYDHHVTPMVHTTLGHAKKHLDKTFGHVFGKPEEVEGEAPEVKEEVPENPDD